MKTLFFIAALLGSVYLILQTPAGKAWMEESEPELEIQQEVPKVADVSTQVIQSIENKVSELAQNFGQKQQAQIDQLENRIAELENELIMGRIAQKQPQNASDGVVTLHPYNQTEEALETYTTEQNNSVNTPKPAALAANSNKQLQRKRQAKLQDIADKMEMSSLQALVN
ncbi:hypothetical protein [Paraglaciecola arctica]|uniref:Uncharacterized protein n=1 Tax=Paraglaciecola arctica BSs20135 TaxID=493475 RepID=K6Z9W8_9ALTE|nr:hypothetical protein [Paraglaciecola arctica]GAC20240.1 hypothetical protein GARC_3281 [Paraglaciecola arctica BSs20135]